MTGTIIVHEPGTYRGTVVTGSRSYERTYWGTLDQQIREATADNLRLHSGLEHKPMDLWTMAYDCGHQNPEDAEEYEGVDDLLDEWWKRNFPESLTYKDGELYYRNRRRGYYAVPEYAAWLQADNAWQDVHGDGVCRDSYQGTCCAGCTEGDEDFGYEPGDCDRQYLAKEAQNEFWWLFSDENDSTPNG
jgi:hypothetical protein